MLFDGLLGGPRYTQASPILPDVWLAYGASPDDPHELLITPHRNGRAEIIARDLRRAVAEHRKRSARGERRGGRIKRAEPRIACMPGLVAANLYFDELIRLVLTRTDWWVAQGQALAKVLGLAGGPSADARPSAASPFQLDKTRVQAIGDKIDELLARPRIEGAIVRKGEMFSHDLLWLVALVGAIRAPAEAGGARQASSGRRQAEAFCELFADGSALSFESMPIARRESGEGTIWRVTLNRTTEAAIRHSSLAVKADAARLLFNISCRSLTWAVLDSGIDGTHPAFWDWRDPTPPANGGAKPSRVDRTYDFTKVRDLLDPAATANLFRSSPDRLTGPQKELRERLIRNLQDLGVPQPEREAPRRVKQLQDRLNVGLEIDWGLLEPFLRVLDPSPPPTGHGTHVAGILAADWRAPKETGRDEHGAPVQTFEVQMQGICPDIRLYDMRVLAPDAPVREFEVIAALQFIAHLNRRADVRLVHGANLSLSTPHEVTNHACGSTPICEACNSLWASGVVLVAAAGNNGHQRYRLASGSELGGYHPISITDPGNAEGVITVGATHYKAHQYGVSYFSSRGPTGDGRRKPDLVAPGEKITGPLPGATEGEGTGTSCAAPHVSGAAALLMARFEELRGRPAKVKQVLCGTATDLGREPYFQGAGMLDILRALQSL
jgi:serine protease AprX